MRITEEEKLTLKLNAKEKRYTERREEKRKDLPDWCKRRGLLDEEIDKISNAVILMLFSAQLQLFFSSRLPHEMDFS